MGFCTITMLLLFLFVDDDYDGSIVCCCKWMYKYHEMEQREYIERLTNLCVIRLCVDASLSLCFDYSSYRSLFICKNWWRFMCRFLSNMGIAKQVVAVVLVVCDPRRKTQDSRRNRILVFLLASVTGSSDAGGFIEIRLFFSFVCPSVRIVWWWRCEVYLMRPNAQIILFKLQCIQVRGGR